MSLNIGDRKEHLPYVKAGFAVVSFDLDGNVPDLKRATNAQLAAAATAFRNAEAGMANVQTALDFALKRVPAIDPERVYIAGHSSAATLSLLAATKEPRIKGCIAYAPVTDIPKRLTPAMPQLSPLMPWLADFARDTSPHTHVAELRCPAFLFHAADDSNVPITDSSNFAAELKKTNQNVTFVQVARGDHYDSMISQGIPKGIEWLQKLAGMEVMAVKPPLDNPMPRKPGQNPNPMPAADTKLTKANFDMIQAGMTQGQLVNLLGNPSNTGPTVRVGKFTTQNLIWQENVASITVVMRNGRAFNKSAFGLK
jgi:dienelactone hydrolase